MNALQTIRLDQEFDIVRRSISDIQRAVRGRLVRDFQLRVDILLTETHAAGQLSQTLVRLVSGLVDDVDVEVVGLLREKRFAEVEELVRVGL